MRYVLNSAVITAPGSYEYVLATKEEITAWLQEPFVSTIGYPETAAALSALTGIEVPVDRSMVRMQPSDEALVFRLVLPAGDRRIPVDAKGRLGADYILAHCEMGILRRFL